MDCFLDQYVDPVAIYFRKYIVLPVTENKLSNVLAKTGCYLQ